MNESYHHPFFTRYVKWLNRYKGLLAILFILFFSLSVWKSSHLKLRSDFKQLLPENFQSVKDINRIAERMGGEGSLIVTIESKDPALSIRFANDLIAELKKYPPEYIYQIDYNVSDAKKFFEENKYLYMSLEDLQQIHDRLERRIQREKIKKTGLFLDLMSKEEKDKEFTTKDIEEKYRNKVSSYDQYIDGYFFGENGKLMAIVIRPPGSASGIDFSKKLVAKVKKTIEELNPSKYDSSLKVGLTGKFLRVLFEYQTLINDIVSTAALCVFLVLLSVYLYFKQLRMVLLMSWSLLNGVVWTFALTASGIGYLTTQTAFLGSIIVGNGINYSLILMARYIEERKKGTNSLDSLIIAIPSTLKGTLASSLNTSVAFGILIITEIRGFSHFGFIGGIGMLFCWLATYSVLPVFLMISEKIWPAFKKEDEKKIKFSLMNYLSIKITPWAKKLTYTSACFTFLCVPLLISFVPRSLEYDFSKLKVKGKGAEMNQEDLLNTRVRSIFGTSMNPAVLMADKTEQVIPLCNEIIRKADLDPAETRVIESCKSLYSYIPENQPEKIVILKQIREMIEKNSLNFLTADQKNEMQKFKSQFKDQTVSLENLPETITKRFREKNGDLGKVVFVYPSINAPLWAGKNLMKFSDIIRENKLPTGEVITASGDSVIFSDLLKAVSRDGFRATVFALLGIISVVILLYQTKKAVLFILGTLFIGILWMGGLIALFNIKINFFNFIAIPTTFGIGVDYGVNIYQRYHQEGVGSLPKVLKTTGGAVFLCSLTTIIGYFTLIIARNQALVSFGQIAIIGEVSCLLTALIFIPALIIYLENRKKQAT